LTMNEYLPLLLIDTEYDLFNKRIQELKSK
jgi:hypothetical protein